MDILDDMGVSKLLGNVTNPLTGAFEEEFI